MQKSAKIFSSSDAELLLSAYIAAEVFACEVNRDALEAATASVAGSTVEVLIDRALMADRPDGLRRIPTVESEFPWRNRCRLWWAARQHSAGAGLELRGVWQPNDPIWAYVEALLDSLRTPFRPCEPTLQILPRAFAIEQNVETDTLIVKLEGECSVTVNGNGSVPWHNGALYFWPKGTRWGFDVTSNARLLLFHPIPKTVVEVVSDWLKSRESDEPDWQFSLKGLFAKSFEARNAANVVGAVCSGLNAAGAGAIMTPQGAPFINGAATQRVPLERYSDSEYFCEEQEWGVKGIRRREDDIYLVTYPRSGTTWLQMILFQILGTGSLEEIDHIYQVSPYAEVELGVLGSAERIEALPGPRAFKTHLPFKSVYSRKGKYIYGIRRGIDVAVSGYYHRIEMSSGGPMPFDIFFDRFLRQPGWFEHVAEWWVNRAHSNILIVEYDDMLKDLRRVAQTIADFCGLAIPSDKMRVLLERCSFPFMKSHERKFHHTEGMRWLQTQRAGPGFIRKGKSADVGELISAHQRSEFERVYRGKMGPVSWQLDC